MFTNENSADAVYGSLGESRWSMECDENVNVLSLWWNEGTCHLMGYDYDKEYFQTLPPFTHLHPDDLKHTMTALQNVLNDQSGLLKFDIEHRFLTANGQYKWVRSVGKPIRNEEKKRIKFYGLITDIDDHKKNELKRQKDLIDALAAVKHANNAKTQFLNNMSHDIRTPMNAIIGFSDIIAEHPDDEEIVKNAISKIQASGEILLKIINDVLDLSKIESGKAEIVEMVTDLKQMEENLKMMLEYSIQKGMIDFKVEDQIENPLVWCDATKLQQVLVNVLNNAVKFTPAGGTITFSCVQRMIAPGFAEYKFTIKDTGIGMTEEFQKHAFEAFERERTSTESKTEGTGLGLAIVKKLVDLMHGDVIIQSNSGQGTKIQISLPLRIATENQLHQSDKAKEYKIGLDGMHVLLVEDNELNAEIAMEVLKNKGILVNWVPDGCACVEEIQNKEAGTYQFILMDVQMPRMNGYEATQKIRQLADVKKAQIPIIAMTANAFEEDRKHALDAGMDGFIMKPFRVDEMMKVIGEVME